MKIFIILRMTSSKRKREEEYLLKPFTKKVSFNDNLETRFYVIDDGNSFKKLPKNPSSRPDGSSIQLDHFIGVMREVGYCFIISRGKLYYVSLTETGISVVDISDSKDEALFYNDVVNAFSEIETNILFCYSRDVNGKYTFPKDVPHLSPAVNDCNSRYILSVMFPGVDFYAAPNIPDF